MALIVSWTEATGAKQVTCSTTEETLVTVTALLARPNRFMNVIVKDDEGRKVSLPDLVSLASIKAIGA
jgi:hypothetical protein